MALSASSMAALADLVIAGALREQAESSAAMEKWLECVAAVGRGEMTEELVWSDSGDLSVVFKPVVP